MPELFCAGEIAVLQPLNLGVERWTPVDAYLRKAGHSPAPSVSHGRHVVILAPNLHTMGTNAQAAFEFHDDRSLRRLGPVQLLGITGGLPVRMVN